MSFKTSFCAGFALLIVITLMPSTSQAQRFQPVKGPFRWLGHGYSDGYNSCSPMTNSDYYNPYSAHNSMLISQSPEYLHSAIQSTDMLRTRKFHQGIPFSVYAAPGGNHHHHSPTVGGSFEPVQPADAAGDEDDAKTDDETNENDSAFSFPRNRSYGSPSLTSPAVTAPASTTSSSSLNESSLDIQPTSIPGEIKIGETETSELYDPFAEDNNFPIK
jgi:hypothetical protein